MAITSILLILVAPSLRSLIERNHFTLVENRLLHALSYAKLTAIQKNKTLMLCGSENGKICNGDWQRNWLVVNVENQQVLHIFSNKLSKTHLSWKGNFKNRGGVYFNNLGETMGQQGRFVLQSAQQKVEVILIATGRVRVSL